MLLHTILFELQSYTVLPFNLSFFKQDKFFFKLLFFGFILFRDLAHPENGSWHRPPSSLLLETQLSNQFARIPYLYYIQFKSLRNFQGNSFILRAMISLISLKTCIKLKLNLFPLGTLTREDEKTIKNSNFSNSSKNHAIIYPHL